MKNRLLIGLLVVLILAIIWWWKRGQASPPNLPEENNSTSSNSGRGYARHYLESQCGRLSELYRRGRSDANFAAVKLGRNLAPQKCQTYLLQHILNTKGRENLVLDGIFGPKTEAAVKKHTGQLTTQLKNHL